MRRANFGLNESLEDATGESDIPYVIMLVMTVGWAFWIMVFVDSRIGNQEVRDDQVVIDRIDSYEIVKPSEKVVPRKELQNLQDDLEEQNQRADEAEEFAIAMGVQGFNGSPVGVIMIVDLTMSPGQREKVKRYIRHMQAKKFVLLACGDEVEAGGRRLAIVNDATADKAAKKLDMWPQATERRLLDAIEGALSIDGATRIVLCLAGQPSGGTQETIEYLKRRIYQVPINGLDYSTDPTTGVFLAELSAITGGIYQKGR